MNGALTGGVARALGLVLGVVGGVVILAWTLVIAAASAEPSDGISPTQFANVSREFDAWTPPATAGGTWQRTDRSTGPASQERCGVPVAWEWTSSDRDVLTLTRVRCDGARAAYELTDNYAGQIEDLPLPASRPNIARVVSGDEQAQVVWRQRNVFMALSLDCGTPTAGCTRRAEEAAAAADQVAPNVPKADPAPPQPVTYLLAPFVFWLVLVAPIRAAQRLRRQRSASVDAPPPYRDVSRHVRRATQARYGRVALWSIAVLSAGIAVLTVLSIVIAGGTSSPVVAVVAAVVAGASGFAASRMPGAGRRGRFGGAAPKGARGKVGHVFQMWSATIAVFTLFAYVTCVLAAAVANRVSLDVLFFSFAEATHHSGVGSTVRSLVLLLALGFRDGVDTAIAFVVVPSLLIAYVLRVVGQALLTADAKTLREQDRRPPILYLRAFDDDGLKMPAPTLRRGPVERLIPWRRRTFERVLVETLSSYGPVVTVADPRKRRPVIGAARENVAHEHWRDAVQRMVGDALVVVVNCTPAVITEGLQWELSTLAGIADIRLLVVRAPHRRQELARRWNQFTAWARVRGGEVFEPLAQPWVQDGTLVAGRAPGDGWTAWGATHGSDRDYAAAIRAAFELDADRWFGEFVRQHNASRTIPSPAGPGPSQLGNGEPLRR